MPRTINVTGRRDQGGRSALHHAAFDNDAVQIERWLSCAQIRLDLNAEDGFKRTPLHDTIYENVDDSHYQVARLLLKNGANINAKNIDDQTPLFDLVRDGCIRMFQLFLQFDADFKVVDCDGENLLFQAVRYTKYVDVVQLLINQGLDVNHRNREEKTPLHYVSTCIKNKILQYNIAERLLISGANVNARDKEGRTPFFYLLKSGNLQTVQLFLKFNVDLSALDEDGRTLLYAAVYNKNVEVAKHLISLGLKADHQDNEKKTPLHEVCDFKFNIKMIKVLLAHGADMNSIDDGEATPITICMDSLLEQDGKIKRKNKQKILELIVLSVNDREFNILNFDSQPDTNYLWKMIIEYLVELESLGIELHSVLDKTIKKHEKYRKYYENCQKEISRAKETRLKHSRKTYYDLLVGNRVKLNSIAGNKRALKELDFSGYVKEFPIYGLKMDKKVKKAVKRRTLFDKASLLLSDCLPVLDSTPRIIKDVLNCVINKKDLLTFCDNGV